MKCFVHIHDEANSVCKRCGKGMCGNCSAYSGHSGICPECRRNDFIAERQSKYNELAKNKTSTTKNIILAVVFVVLAIVLMIVVESFYVGIPFLIIACVFGVRIIHFFRLRKPIEERITYLTTEIDKLTVALQRSTAEI